MPAPVMRRTALWCRVTAGVVLVGLASGLAVGWCYAKARRAPALPSEVAVSGLTAGGATWRFPAGSGRAAVLLYVSPRCPHCHLELGRWADVARRHPELFATVDLVIITPGDAPPDEGWIPDGLAYLPVRDPDGTIARTLGVRAVPQAVYASADGSVRAITVGETGVEGIRRDLARLGAASS